MAKDNDEFQEVELTLGDKKFEQMLMVLNHGITKENASEYNFNGNEMQEVGENVWAVPAYLADHYSLFFLYTQIDTKDWVVAFAEGKMQKEQFELGVPMTTGKGLNVLAEKDMDRAQMVTGFVNDISKAGEGEWRMIEDDGAAGSKD
ncbi:hypothetical protein [Pediococcus cellicola]|uniref:Uncharacterized protein n=1 Tax=Pediococcus cellicola TaxID=319652 RepID=A0A0R2IQW9_9LACO|nr:hypothetical protein [Pediococcus cellicola]KRN67150.1 hypothetical protein IV80_GL000678 [Pediococcus cellicola]GEL14787.1 hypothetical protein PCE01_05890 [Pediococcus cellicola]